MNIPSILRHWFTLAATAVSVWLVAMLMLTPDETVTLNHALDELATPVITILALVFTALWRIALAKIGSSLRRSAGETSGTTGGLSPLLIAGLATTAGILGCLPSCTAEQLAAARAVPIHIGIDGPNASLGYSSKSGLDVRARIQGDK